MSRVSTVLALAIGLSVWWGELDAQPGRDGGAVFEAMARERARIDTRRYALWRANLDRPQLEGEALAESLRLDAEVRALNERIRNEPTLRDEGYRLSSRVRELVVADIGASWNALMLQRYPTPERLRADFPDDLRCCAALVVIGYDFTFMRTIRPPRTPELDARDAAYTDAAGRLQTELTKGLRTERAKEAFETELRALTSSPTFRREVVGRYVPLFASFIAASQTPEPSKSPIGWQGWLHRPLSPLSDGLLGDLAVGHVLLGLAPLAVLVGGPLVVVLLVRRTGLRAAAARSPAASDGGRLALPEALRFPDFGPRFRPELNLSSGIVVDEKTWTETHVTTTTVTSTNAPSRTSVSSTTVQKDRLWIRTFEGREEEWTVTGAVFSARGGHHVSWLTFRPKKGRAAELALMYNHQSGKVFERPWIWAAHGSGWGVFLRVFVIWVLPWTAAADVLARAMAMPIPFWSYLPPVALAWLLPWAVISRWWVVRGRSKRWEVEHRPRVLEMLQRFGDGMQRAAQDSPPNGP